MSVHSQLRPLLSLEIPHALWTPLQRGGSARRRRGTGTAEPQPCLNAPHTPLHSIAGISHTHSVGRDAPGGVQGV